MNVARVPVLPGLVAVLLVGGTCMSSAYAVPYDIAILQGIDKVTARVSTLLAPVGLSVRFGTLEIIARHCDKRPPEDPPESAAFLDIRDVRPEQVTQLVYRGWMFASSPAISPLEHPVYDILVLDCTNREPVAGESDAAGRRGGSHQ